MSDVIGIVNEPKTDYVTWLKGLAKKGGKGVVNNIDARSLGQVASTIELQASIINADREITKALNLEIKKLQRQLYEEKAKVPGYISTINL